MLSIVKWFLMLTKRLYKKVSFVALLVLIPLCVFAFSVAAKQDGGFIHIALAQSDSNDAISSEIIAGLLDESSLIRFSYSPSAQQAIDSVKNGAVDEAWVFTENTGDMLDGFAGGNSQRVVSVYTKEQSVALRLSREKLSGELYKYCAKSYFIDYIRANVPELCDVSDEQLELYFETTAVDDSLFVFEDINGNPSTGDTNYLTSPIRGLLAVLALLSAMAAAMYFKQDDKNGTFSYVKEGQKPLVEFGCILTAVLNVSIVLLLSLYLSSLSHNILKEIAVLVLYSVCCTSFCLLLGQLFKNLNILSVITPLVTIIVIAVCPVFFDFRSLHTVQLLLPPTYYVNSIYSDSYLVYMVIYSVICVLISLVLKFIAKLIHIKR